MRYSTLAVYFILAAVVTLPVSSYSQTAVAPPSATDMDTSAALQLFFHHLDTIDEMYALASKEHRDTSHWRNYDLIASGLSTEQWDVIRTIASDTRASLLQDDQKLSDLRTLASSGNAFGDSSDRLRAIDEVLKHRAALLQAALLRFRAASNEQAYQTFLSYLQRTTVVVPSRLSSVTIKAGATSYPTQTVVQGPAK